MRRAAGVRRLTPAESRVRIRNYLGTVWDLDRLQAARAALTDKPGLFGPPDPVREASRQARMFNRLTEIGFIGGGRFDNERA